jgi:hypothetical protein
VAQHYHFGHLISGMGLLQNNLIGCFGSIAAFDYQYMEFRPMFNRPPHLSQAWGPFFGSVKTSPPWSGLPVTCRLVYSSERQRLKMGVGMGEAFMALKLPTAVKAQTLKLVPSVRSTAWTSCGAPVIAPTGLCWSWRRSSRINGTDLFRVVVLIC